MPAAKRPDDEAMTTKAMAAAVWRVAQWAGLAIVMAPIFISIPSFDIQLLRILDLRIPPEHHENAISLLSLFIAALGITLVGPLLKAVSRRQPLVFTVWTTGVPLGFLLGTMVAKAEAAQAANAAGPLS
jgi:hypothetical protein